MTFFTFLRFTKQLSVGTGSPSSKLALIYAPSLGHLCRRKQNMLQQQLKEATRDTGGPSSSFDAVFHITNDFKTLYEKLNVQT